MSRQLFNDLKAKHPVFAHSKILRNLCLNADENNISHRRIGTLAKAVSNNNLKTKQKTVQKQLDELIGKNILTFLGSSRYKIDLSYCVYESKNLSGGL